MSESVDIHHIFIRCTFDLNFIKKFYGNELINNGNGSAETIQRIMIVFIKFYGKKKKHRLPLKMNGYFCCLSED